MTPLRAASLSLTYKCVFPVLEKQPMTVEVRGDFPASVPAGTSIPEVELQGMARVNNETRDALSFIGATELQGRVRAEATMAGPNLDMNLSVPLTIDPQPIPDQVGPLNVAAKGKLPSFAFQKKHIGEVVIRVDNLVATLFPVDHNGGPTGMGRFESECLVEPEQNRELHRFVVTDSGSGADPVLMNIRGESRLGAPDKTLTLDGTMETPPAETGDFSGELELEPTGANLELTHFAQALTLDADFAFEHPEPATQSLRDGVLVSQSQMHIDLPRVELRSFGFTLARGGGEQCRTREPVEITLDTPEGHAFEPDTGGRLTGTYEFPPVENCGALTWLINQAVTGPDNALDLSLQPADGRSTMVSAP